MKRVPIVLVLFLFIVACAAPLPQNNAPQNSTDVLEKIVREYGTWTRLFDAPRSVSAQLMTLCRLILEDEQAYLDSEHAQYFVQVYVNPVGEKMMRETGTRIFPEGTIIVKEKWMRDESTGQPTAAKQPAGMGIMFKQSDGWQYAYADESGKITRDQNQLEHCRTCHIKQQAQDSVFYPQVLGQ